MSGFGSGFGPTQGAGKRVLRLHTDTTSYTTSGTSEETAASYTLKGGTLAADHQFIKILVSVSYAANGNSKTVTLKFGATSIYATAHAINGNSGLFIAEVIRKSATTQVATAAFIRGNFANNTTPAETLSGDVVVAVTLTTGSASGDATFNWMTIDLHE